MPINNQIQNSDPALLDKICSAYRKKEHQPCLHRLIPKIPNKPQTEIPILRRSETSHSTSQ